MTTAAATTETMPAHRAEPGPPVQPPVHKNDQRGGNGNDDTPATTISEPTVDVDVHLVVSARMRMFGSPDAVRQAVLEWVRLSTSMIVGNLADARLGGVAQHPER